MGHDEHGPAYPEPPIYCCPVCRGDKDRFITCDYPGCPDGCDQSRFKTYDTPEMKEATATATAKVIWFAIMVAALAALLLWPHRAPAMDHGFNPNDKAVRWMETLKIPPEGMVSCCGEADAYPVDRYEKQPDGGYKVWIEDGSPRQYPDNTSRVPWDVTVPVIVPADRVNTESDDLDNPTDHGWLFFVPKHSYPADGSEPAPSTEVSEVICFVRHPQGQ